MNGTNSLKLMTSGWSELMKVEQELSTKYWVGHDSRTEDLFLTTMYKYRQDTIDEMVRLYGEDWEDEHPHFKIDLIGIQLVPVNVGHVS